MECAVHVPNEVKTGADFDFVVVSGTVGTHFRVQAKRIFWQKHRYTKMDQYSRTTGFQVDTLCRPGRGFIPLYLFYNWYRTAHTQEELRLDGEGCCIAAATRIKALLGSPYAHNLAFPNVADLQVPWWYLVCPRNGEVDLSVVALDVAKNMGATETEDWGETRRQLEEPYLRLWQSMADPTERDLVFKRPVVMVGHRSRQM